MGIEHDIGPMTQIPQGEGRNFDIGGRRIAVFRTHDDEVFATQPDCPHRGGPLADGLMGGATIVCPLHDRAYDLRTGAATGDTCGLAVFALRLTTTARMVVTV